MGQAGPAVGYTPTQSGLVQGTQGLSTGTPNPNFE